MGFHFVNPLLALVMLVFVACGGTTPQENTKVFEPSSGSFWLDSGSPGSAASDAGSSLSDPGTAPFAPQDNNTSFPPQQDTTSAQDAGNTGTEPDPVETVSSSIGLACTTDADCTDVGAFCVTDFPGGYCMIEGCTTTGCPAGSICDANFSNGASYCLKSCAASSECRVSEGYDCDQYNTCWPLQEGNPTPTPTPEPIPGTTPPVLDDSADCELTLRAEVRDEGGACTSCTFGEYITVVGVVENLCTTVKTYESNLNCVVSEFIILNLFHGSSSDYPMTCSGGGLVETVDPGEQLTKTRPAGKLSVGEYRLTVYFEDPAQTEAVLLFDVE